MDLWSIILAGSKLSPLLDIRSESGLGLVRKNQNIEINSGRIIYIAAIFDFFGFLVIIINKLLLAGFTNNLFITN